MYIRLPIENDPPPTLGYEIKYVEEDRWRTAILVGESAADPNTLARIFRNRDQLSIVFFPISEQSKPRGVKFIEELAAHASLRTFAILERIVKKGTIIVPLHQGLWYFQVTSSDIVNGRLALEKLAHTSSSLPIVKITKLFNEISSKQTNDNRFLNQYRSLRNRWKLIKKIANEASFLPISGNIDGFPPGKLLEFSFVQRNNHIHSISIDAIQSALQAHFMEFEGMRDEIISAWEWQKDLIQYTLLIIGTTLTLVNALPQLELLLLVASYMLSAIGWSFMEQSIRMTTIGRYFKSILNPTVNSLILELDTLQIHHPLKEKLKVWMWEDFFRGGNIRTALMGWAAMGKFSIAVIPGIAFAIAYYFQKQFSGMPWTFMEIIGFIVASGMGLMPLSTAIFNARFSFKGEGVT